MLTAAFAAWAREGLSGLRSGEQDLTPLAFWAVLTVALWWVGRYLRRRFGRGDVAEPMQRDRTLAAAIDGVGLVLVPILAVWLIGRLLAATMPPPPLDTLLSDLIIRLITVLLVVGLTATALAPHRPAWRVLPFTDDSAQQLSTALRRLLIVGVLVDFVYIAFRQGREHDAIVSVGVAGDRDDRRRADPAGAGQPRLGGAAAGRLRRAADGRRHLVVGAAASDQRRRAGLDPDRAARATRPSPSTSMPAIAATCMWVALALLAHQLAGDLLDAVAAPDLPTGRWVRGRFGLPADFALRGQNIVLLLIDLVLVVAAGGRASRRRGASTSIRSWRGFDQLAAGRADRRRHDLAGQYRHGDRDVRRSPCCWRAWFAASCATG